MTNLTITHEEPYTTTTGTTVTLVRHHVERESGPFPADYWTWRYANGWWAGTYYLTDFHLTREAAIARLEEQETITTLAGSDYSPLDRGAYERLCQAAHIDPISDEEIAHSYGARFGQFSLPDYSVTQIVTAQLQRRRQIALDDEADARVQIATPPKIIVCPNCGAETTQRNLMSASFGTACPECYDTLSDEAHREVSA